jgi:hypothetical protein
MMGFSAGWYLRLGFWAMLHEPVHFVVFLVIITILPVMIYTAVIMLTLYSYLKEAYIDVSASFITVLSILCFMRSVCLPGTSGKRSR